MAPACWFQMTTRSPRSTTITRDHVHFRQSTATSSAAQTSRIRASLRRPIRSRSTPTETLSTESKLTADRSGTGSSPGSSSTSLGNPRMFVVHGAMSARRSRGIATSRESTTTGRRPTSAGPHHHNSPRAGSWLTMSPRRPEMTIDHPTRRAYLVESHRRRRTWRPPRRHDVALTAPPRLRREARRRSTPTAADVRSGEGSGPRLCSPSPWPCHKHGI